MRLTNEQIREMQKVQWPLLIWYTAGLYALVWAILVLLVVM